MTTHTLYRFYDAKNVLLYVGLTSDLGTRWKSHANGKSWWSDVAHMTVQRFSSRDELRQAEIEAIQSEKPLYNIQHAGPQKRARAVMAPKAELTDPDPTSARYTAACRRCGSWWAISVPEVKGVHSQAKRLDQVEGKVREAIALMLGVTPDSFNIEVRPEGVPTEVAVAIAARMEADDLARRADLMTSNAVSALLAQGLTVRDIGVLLGLSPQRISQISQTFRVDPKTVSRWAKAGCTAKKLDTDPVSAA